MGSAGRPSDVIGGGGGWRRSDCCSFSASDWNAASSTLHSNMPPLSRRHQLSKGPLGSLALRRTATTWVGTMCQRRAPSAPSQNACDWNPAR
eukprot:6679674-Prymnesium_polylepis.1